MLLLCINNLTLSVIVRKDFCLLSIVTIDKLFFSVNFLHFIIIDIKFYLTQKICVYHFIKHC